jgi:hypothetical protein
MPDNRLKRTRDSYLCPYCNQTMLDGKHIIQLIYFKDFPFIGCPTAVSLEVTYKIEDPSQKDP